jgi:hypothetical protein
VPGGQHTIGAHDLHAAGEHGGIMTPDDQPYCGVELLPHAAGVDGTPAPVLCTRQMHGLGTMHGDDETGMSWQWQDAGGNWLGV